MKRLILSVLVLCAGILKADDGMEKLAQESADKVTKEHPFFEANPPSQYPGIHVTNSIEQFICPSGWEKSGYSVTELQEPAHYSQLIPVEICSDNGLLRVNIKGKI